MRVFGRYSAQYSTDIDEKNDGQHRRPMDLRRWELQLMVKARGSVVAAEAPRDSGTQQVE